MGKSLLDITQGPTDAAATPPNRRPPCAERNLRDKEPLSEAGQGCRVTFPTTEGLRAGLVGSL